MSAGLMVMLNHVFGSKKSAEILTAVLGKRIEGLKLIPTDRGEDALRLTFSDTSIELFDAGQSCCERRYMRTDDDLSDFVGAELISVEVRDVAPGVGECDECHEIQFLVVQTSKGDLTLSSHNEHNGYYGGFAISCREVAA